MSCYIQKKYILYIEVANCKFRPGLYHLFAKAGTNAEDKDPQPLLFCHYLSPARQMA